MSIPKHRETKGWKMKIKICRDKWDTVKSLKYLQLESQKERRMNRSEAIVKDIMT